MTRSRPTLSRSAISTGAICIVEQFGLATMPGMALEIGWIDLRDDQRDGRVHPPGRRVVDDRRTVSDRRRGKLLRDVAAGREQGDVDAGEGLGDGLPDLERATVDRHCPSGRPAGGEQAQLTDRELPLVEDLDHRSADDAGGTDDGNGQGLTVHGGCGLARPVAGSGTAGV